MVGQHVELAGVTAAAGRATVDMHAGDRVAARLAPRHVISPRTFKKLDGGGVSGRCRATGAELIGIGSNFTAMTIKALAGVTALTPESGFSQIAGLKLPSGSATPSYTVVMAVALGVEANTTTTGRSSEYVGSFKEDGTWVAYMARHRSAGYGATGNGIISSGSDRATPSANISPDLLPPSLTWMIIATEWDDDAGIARAFLNNAKPVQSAAKTVKHLVGDNGYLVIGHPTGTGGLRDNYFSDIYIFDRPLSKNRYDNAGLADLMAALKSVHGVA